MKMKKATAVALAAAVAVGTLGFAVPAKASELIKTTDYTITIPAKLAVEGKGWNGTAGITAKLGAGDVFDSEKKLTVTAESENGWKLKAEGVTDTIGYNLAASGDTNSVYSADEPAASWNFTAAEITTEGTKKDMGIVVEDYTTKVAGNYTDTVTFTAKVEDAVTAPTLAGVTLTDGTGVVIKYNCDGNNTVYFKYVAASDTFVPDYASYDEVYGSKLPGSHASSIVDQNWNGGSNNFYFRKDGNTAHLYGNDGINMNVFDIQLDFDSKTYTQSYKEWYKTCNGSFTSIKIGDTTITASQMTAQ